MYTVRRYLRPLSIFLGIFYTAFKSVQRQYKLFFSNENCFFPLYIFKQVIFFENVDVFKFKFKLVLLFQIFNFVYLSTKENNIGVS